MCGIFGKLYFKNHKQERPLLLSCLDTLTHRGPDDRGFYEDGNIFLGSRRLSIIDRSSRGHMPMANEDKTLWITFNGEIYNYRELRKLVGKKYRFRSRSDTEVVLRLYEERGPACLEKLRGMFAFAIWDTRRKELFLARDQLGKKPLKYYHGGNSLIFASELKAIVKDPSVPKQVDPVAIDQFLTYQYVPSPRTGFLNIRKLEPAHYLIVDRYGKITTKQYWRPEYQPKIDLPPEELENELIKRFRESVKLRLRSDVPVGAHLSGGVDSSLVAAFAAQEMNKPLQTFSVGFDEAGYDELPFARLVSERYQTLHHEIRVGPGIMDELDRMAYHFEEPYADPSLLPTWQLCRETKKELTVVLNGDGGDENFAGYLRYAAFLAASYLHPLPLRKELGIFLSLLSRTLPLTPLRRADKLVRLVNSSRNDIELYAGLVGRLSESKKVSLYTRNFRNLVKGSDAYDYLGNKMGEGVSLEKLLALDVQTYLGEDLLTKVDIAGMAHSLEIRSPFLDQEFMEFSARIPFEEKLKGFEGKHILKRIARRYLPAACIDREKQGFNPPIKKWLQNSLKPEVNALTSGGIVTHGVVEGSRLREALKNNRLDHNDLWTLIMLNKWLEVWFPS